MTIRTDTKNDISVEGKVQRFSFANDVIGVLEIKNGKPIITDVTNVSGLSLLDSESDGYIWLTKSTTDKTTNTLCLYQILNGDSIESILLNSTPIIEINQSSGVVSFDKDIQIVNSDGTSTYATEAYVDSKLQEFSDSGISQADIDNILSQAKEFTKTNTTYEYDAIDAVTITHRANNANEHNVLFTGVPNEQGYVRKALFKVNVSTKAWDFIIDSIDTDPRSTAIVGGDQNNINIYQKKITGLLEGTSNTDAVNRYQMMAKLGEYLTQAQQYADSKGVGLAAGYFTIDYHAAENPVDNTQLTNVGNDYIKDRSQIWEMKIRNLVRYDDDGNAIDDPSAGDEVFFIRQPYMSGLQIGVHNNYLEGNSEFYDVATNTYGLVHIHLKNYECNFRWDTETQTASDNTYGKTYQFRAYAGNYGQFSNHKFYENISYNTQNQNGADNSYGNWKISTPFCNIAQFKTHIRYNNDDSRWEHVSNDIVLNGYPQTEDHNYKPLYQHHLVNKGYVDSGLIPIGGEITVPKGMNLPNYLRECDGSEISANDHGDLWSVYAASGKSITNFNNNGFLLPSRTPPDQYTKVVVRVL